MNPSDLTKEELVQLVTSIKNVLYWDEESQSYNSDKEWTGGTIEDVAEVLSLYELTPK